MRFNAPAYLIVAVHPDAGGHGERTTATRISSELGLEPRHSFDAGVVATDLNVWLALACPDHSHHGS